MANEQHLSLLKQGVQSWKGALRDAVLRPSDRLSATELIGDLRSAAKLDFERELRKIRQETGGVPIRQKVDRDESREYAVERSP